MRKNISYAAVLVASVLLTGCASTQYIKEKDATKVYHVTYDEMFVLVPQAIDLAGMKNKQIMKDQGLVKAVSPPSFWTSSLGNMIAGGDEVKVKITKDTESTTEVYVTVVATASVVDYGRSARVVRTLYKHLDDVVDQKIKARQ